MYDVVIAGAGITGTAIARQLSMFKAKVLVIEKSYDIANGATKANSGIVHAGYDAKPGTLKAKLNVFGNSMFDDMCRELGVKFKRTGSLVLAFNDEELETLKELEERGERNSVKDFGIISAEELRSLEPNVSKKAVGALLANTAGVVSPYELAIALAENAKENGVEFRFNTELKNVRKDTDHFVVETNSGEIESRFFVNAAGVFADKINDMLDGKHFDIIPRKGEYCLLDKNEGSLVSRVIFQAPTEKGKGILVASTIHGNLLVGPNAVEAEDKEDITTTELGLSEVMEGAKKSVDNINFKSVITSFTGVRATSSTGDFVIDSPTFGAVNAAGIDSPGLTSCPAVALKVLELLRRQGFIYPIKSDFNAYRRDTKLFLDMTDEEKSEAIKKDPSYGRIVCRCEHVTEGDIINSIHRSLGATTVDGVKKRTRAGMGRCQGGFCMPRVVDILSRELSKSPEEIMKAGTGSYIITGKTK